MNNLIMSGVIVLLVLDWVRARQALQIASGSNANRPEQREYTPAATPAAATPKHKSVPAADECREYGENIYDYAKAND